jgi:hypothetical protein
MEAVAMKEGLSLVASVGYHQIIAEWDCLQVVQAFSGGNTWWHEGSRIIADCFNLVLEIGTAAFSHCPREANGVAHEIARNSYENHLSCIWVDYPTSFIHVSLVNDVSLLNQ